MARDFPHIKDGDQLEPYHLNIVYKELRRLRKMTAAAPLSLSGMQSEDAPSICSLNQPPILIRLTENGDSDGLHGWEEVLWNQDTPEYETSGLSGSVTDGDAAREINGLKCPLGDDVYQAFRDNWGILTFRAVRILGVCGGSNIAADSSGDVTAWSIQSGAETSAALTLTAYNYGTVPVNASSKIMLTPVANRWYVDFEACSG